MHQGSVLASAERAHEKGSRADLCKDHSSDPLLLEFRRPACRERRARVKKQDSLALGGGEGAGACLIQLHAFP